MISKDKLHTLSLDELRELQGDIRHAIEVSGKHAAFTEFISGNRPEIVIEDDVMEIYRLAGNLLKENMAKDKKCNLE